MTRLQEAQRILSDLGLPPAQQNERSALILLAFAGVGPDTPWTATSPRLLRIVDLMQFISDNYNKTYAPNSREDLRKSVVRPFEHARLVDANPDDPSRATNSPNFAYQLTDRLVEILKAFDSPAYTDAVAQFIAEIGTLQAAYQKARDELRVPLTKPDGTTIHLSPGAHNELQAAIVNDFGPRFAPGATLLYVGDTRAKQLVLEEDELSALGVPITQHDKLPDVVLYHAENNWIFLIEAVTSTGPVSPTRHQDLEAMLSDCTADRVYVSAFPDVATFRKFVAEIAWETEVWIADQPDHMVHFNGPKFCGPYDDSQTST